MIRAKKIQKIVRLRGGKIRKLGRAHEKGRT